jgi:hypothetical protein
MPQQMLLREDRPPPGVCGGGGGGAPAPAREGESLLEAAWSSCSVPTGASSLDVGERLCCTHPVSVVGLLELCAKATTEVVVPLGLLNLQQTAE